jgi:hypothetical protein
MSCGYEHEGGSYVLGALSSAERREFEAHLEECASCRRAVQELAGMPGLLAKVPDDVWGELTGERADEPLPPSLLPSALRAARASRRRHTARVAGLAATAAAVVVTGGFLVADQVDHPGSGPGSSQVVASGRAMTVVGHVPMSGWLTLDRVGWGTKLRLRCQYGDSDGYSHPDGGAVYTLVVRTRGGAVQQVATWRALPGRTMDVVGSTATPAQDIASVEVRAADGTPVLRLTT